MSGGNYKLLGRWGESQVAEYLRKKGYEILAAGWYCKFGEIDLIATDGKYLCFTEVKTRKNDKFAPARCFVDHRKQQKIITATQMYLMQHPSKLQPRFDVAEVYAPEGIQTKNPQIVYWDNAFQ